MSARPSFRGLDPCTHCGFCLPACPTWLASGDEGASPRGRIVVMRALEEGELPPGDPALFDLLSGCTLCGACEPACPSGVAFVAGFGAAQGHLLGAGIVLRPARALPDAEN